MERNMYRNSLDHALAYLEILCQDRHIHDGEFIVVMTQKLRLIKMFLWGLAYWEDLEYGWHMHLSIHTMVSKFCQYAQEFEVDCEHVLFQNVPQGINWEMMHNLEKTIQEFKPQTRDISILLLGGTYQCISCPSNQKKFLEYKEDTASFIGLILQNLRMLQNSGPMAPVMKQHISMIQRGLEEFRMFVDPPRVLFELISRTRAWFNRVSYLTYLCWMEGSDESLASFVETIISSLFQETMPQSSSIGAVSYYFRCTKIHQPLGYYLDLLLQDLATPMKDDVYESVIFLLSFVMDPPVVLDSKMIWAQSFAAMNKFPSLISSAVKKGGVCAVDLSGFVKKVDTIKAKVRNSYVLPPYSSNFPSPSTNIIGFLNSMMLNLKEVLQEQVSCIPSLKHQGEILQKELMPLVRNIRELLINDNEHEDIRGLWSEITSIAYNADYFIKMSHPKGFYLWYVIAGLPSLIQDIKSVKRKIHKLVGDDKRSSSGNHDQMKGANNINVLQLRGTTSEIEGVYMGFMEEKRLTINDLIRGQKSLTIISIWGSGGQGKTTFAKQIYNDHNVQYHFRKSGWCYISKDRPIKEILVQIIKDVNKGDDQNIDVKNKEVQDLVDLFRKSLKGNRYFIVMDDIWDVDTWHELKLSFPDEKNGSRILFTSRNHDLALQARSNSISRTLPLFTDEESWELVKKRVFGSDNFDEAFVGIGRKIARYCKGLPLAVSLTAAVLGRTQQSLDSWNKVAENLKGYLAEEGCGNLLELSYIYLPDYLKSCFLYFGAFQRGEQVRAKELKLLWVGEGFVITNGEAKSTEKDLATKYLKDLVSQGLVVVTERSSMGEIKRCIVHDLLYDLCLEKCREDHFLRRAERSTVLKMYIDTHRLRFGVTDPFIKSSPSVTKRALPISPLHSLTSMADYVLHFIGSFKLVTVLNLRRCTLFAYEFLEVISLVHLRYLAIQLCSSIEAIPSGIANMWKLGTLIVDCRDPRDTVLPLSMWNITSLGHVHITNACLKLDDFDLEVPSNLLGGALNLVALGSLFLDVDDSRTAKVLQNFPNLRQLRCKLSKGSGRIMKLFSMVESLLPLLESLRVAGQGFVPSQMENPSIWNLPKNENLIKLSLYETRIPLSVSEIGKKLPNLRVLKLLGNSCVGESWELEDGDFPKLIYLKLSFLSDLKKIDVSSCCDVPFPCLEHLVLFQCLSLKEIPSIFGEHCTLKTIKVSHCRQGLQDSAVSILEQQRDFGNGSFQVMIDNTYSELRWHINYGNITEVRKRLEEDDRKRVRGQAS